MAKRLSKHREPNDLNGRNKSAARPKRYDPIAEYQRLGVKAVKLSPKVPSRYGRRLFVRSAGAAFGALGLLIAISPRRLIDPNAQSLFASVDIDETLPATGHVAHVRTPGFKPTPPAGLAVSGKNADGATAAELVEYQDREADVKGDAPRPLSRSEERGEEQVASASERYSEGPTSNSSVLGNRAVKAKPSQEDLAPILPRQKGKQPKSLASLIDPVTGRAGNSKPKTKAKKKAKKKRWNGGPTRTLAIRSVNTGEIVRATYMKKGQYVSSELRRLDYVMRDRRDGSVRRIDPNLYDSMYRLTSRLGAKGTTVNMISGFRSRRTNKMLRRRSGGVAKNSYHTRGQAVDLNIPGYRLSTVHRGALAMSTGGVGYYPSSNFIHIDTGTVRSWPSRYNHIARRYRG